MWWINATAWLPEILCRNCGMPIPPKKLYVLKTSNSLIKLDCSLQIKIHFHSRKMNVLLLTIYKSISHTCKRKLQDCSSNHMSIVPWRHVLDYMIRLITQINNSEIVVKTEEANSLFLCVVTCSCHGSILAIRIRTWYVLTAYAYKSIQITQNVSYCKISYPWLKCKWIYGRDKKQCREIWSYFQTGIEVFPHRRYSNATIFSKRCER